MREHPVVYLRTAQLDLGEALQYIAADSPAQARSWAERVDRTVGRLAAFPESGSVPKGERVGSLGYRVVVVGECLVFYVLARDRV